MPGSIEWLSPAPRLRIGDCYEIRNCRLGPCDLLLSSHQNFQHEVRLHNCVFCMGPCCKFGPFTDLAISVFKEMSINSVLTQILKSLDCGLQRNFMRRTGVRVSLFRNFIIHLIFPEFLQPFRNLRIQRVAPFYRSLHFIWFLDFIHRVSLIYHQQELTRALEKCHFQFDLLVLESEFHLLQVKKTSWKKMMRNNFLVLKVSLKLMKIERTNLTSLEHNMNEVLRVAWNPNPVFTEKWFFDH